VVPGEGYWNITGTSGAIAIHAMYTTDETVLFLERPHNPQPPNPNLLVANGAGAEVASIYDIATGTYTPLHVTYLAFCAGHSMAADGTAIIAGGDNVNLNGAFLQDGISTIRTYAAQTLVQNYTDMGTARWYPTTVVLPDSSVVIVGGSKAEVGGYGSPPAVNNPTYQVLNTTTGAITAPVNLTLLQATWPVNLYPFVAVMPVTGSVAILAGASTQVLDFSTTPASVDTRYQAVPDLPIPVNYPQTGSVVLLPLDPARSYAPELLVVGGTSEDQATYATPASDASYRINLGAATPEWEQETMPFRRVMGDTVLLPDGTVFVTNGAQIGIAGGLALAAAASDGTTVACLYNPYAPAGSRWSALADSGIQRLYHSVAFLLSSGEVLVAGSEATLDYRVQHYVPAYLTTASPRPVISTAPPTVTYDTQFAVGFSAVSGIDRVVMIRQSAVTHSTHMDERLVVLVISVSNTAGIVTAVAPPDSTIAPPGMYMLFIMYQGVPSRAAWVQLSS
jgi:hypothetical protein